MNIKKTWEGFKVFKNGVENWFSVALNMFVLKKDVTCRIKNIGSVHLRGGKLSKFLIVSCINLF